MASPALQIRTDSSGRQWISSTELQESIFGPKRRIPQSEQWRRYFGSGLSPATIESVLNAATFGGHMQGLADLEAETLSLDPTFAHLVQKRTAALASIDPQIVPASGDGVTPESAKRYADQFRQELAGIRGFRSKLVSLSWAHFSGRAALEKDWIENSRRTTGLDYQWSLKGLNWIHSRRLSFGPSRELRVRDDRYSGAGFEAVGLDLDAIPHKFITFTPQLFDEYPEREGYGARGVYWALFKRMTQAQRVQLIEVFGLPWRLIETDLPYDADVLDDLQERVDGLGGLNSAATPKGVSVKTDRPDAKSTEAHRLNIQDCNEELAKLVLWGVRTSESRTDGLGGTEAAVHQDGETLAIAGDGWRISEALSDALARDWVVLNYGEAEAINAPEVQIEYSIPENRTDRTNRLRTFVEMGAPVLRSEAYETAGFSVPQNGDEVLKMDPVQPQANDFGGSERDPLAATAARGLRLLKLSRSESA